MFSEIENIEIHVTDKCNLSCSYCYLKEKENVSDEFFSTQLFDVFFEKYKASRRTGGVKISFWGGEPLMNFPFIKHVIQKVSRWKGDEHDNNKFIIITNGTLINHSMARFFKKYNVRLQVTLDGDQKCHDSQRKSKSGEGTYRKITEKINVLQQYNVDYNIRCTVTKNSPHPSKIIKNFKENSINNVFFGIVTPNGSASYDKNEPLTNGKEIANNLFYDFLSSSKIDNFYYHNINFIIEKFITGGECTSCGVSKNKILINYDGNIYPCHRFVNYHEFCIGNIWDGILDKYQYDKIYRKNKKCQSCELAGIFCGGPCFYETLKKDIDYTQEDICEFNRFLCKNILKLSANLFLNDKEEFNKLIKNYLMIDTNNNQNVKDVINKEMNRNVIFLKSKHARIIDLNEEGIIYLTPEFRKKYIANTTAMAIWDLLDGQRTAQQIIQEIANVCEVEFETIKDDIYDQLAAFQELGLVEEVQAESHA